MPDTPDPPPDDADGPKPPAPIAGGPLPHLRSRPKTVEDLAAKLAANHHGGSRPRYPIFAWAGILAGLAAMGVAVGVLLIGLQDGRIVFGYGLLFTGFAAFVNGLLGNRPE